MSGSGRDPGRGRGRGRRPGTPPRGGRAPVDPARLAAFEVLKAVRVEDAYANLVLPHVLGRLGLSGRDAAFATELASGTLRGQGTYDAILAGCVDRPLAKVEAKVLDALRLGTHQLLAMRVPTHAAIATTVDLVKSKVGPGAGGFANAVLRKVAERSMAEWTEGMALPERTSHPAWMVELLRDALDVPDELEALLAADNAPPRVTLVARPGRASRAEIEGEPTTFSPYGVRLAGGSPLEVPAVAEGRAGVQDEGSQLVALALAQAPVKGRDERWLDLCAGPGGKAALLDALAAEAGAVLIGNERQHHRARLVRANGVARVVAADGIRPPFAPGTFDRVLVDAPCSGLGALRRRPEARWRRRPADVTELVPLQRDLLRSALDLTRPGGVVVYATCSPVLAETRDVVVAVVSEDPGVLLEPVSGAAGDVPDARGPLPGTVQLWPHRHGTDAMFIAALRKEESR
ncbi:transcription antitermination factor NusB [Nocardioides sp. BP30]|uniref:RsmB/NOP family class I SAM-dependent RNA methyltransferase n=1 Tax=Nocardioides sp. BP30 TaxID=3036374 RepID=UPI0024684DF9|nr:transcription antitermination factor NusB [Nocardioides sp. BP30]WGL50469.1 transcription antitermination factor NusB [Nocardioides sp. BP30]